MSEVDLEKEGQAKLRALRKRIQGELRESLGRVSALETPMGDSAASLEQMIAREYERFGGGPPDLEEPE